MRLMRLLLVLLFASLVTSAMAQSDLDWVRAQPEEDLGIASPERTALPMSVGRIDLLNFTMTANVHDIDDGDTIDVKGRGGAQFVIRFSDMDTPEVEHKAFNDAKCACNSIPFRPGQPGGKAATTSLMELIAVGDEVELQCYEADRYGRLVCHIFKGDLNVNLEMIKRGWGWLPNNTAWVRDPESTTAEQQAKAAKLGAWALPDQIAPGDWRKACWVEGECANAE